MSSVDQIKSLASSKLGFARSNQFLVELPTNFQGSTGFLGTLTTLLTSGTNAGGDLNILCSNVSLPGKQILTSDRRIGMEFQKVAYGYAVEDVTMTFYALNDYGVRKYFDSWVKSIINEEGHVSAYKNQYQKDIKIHQLRKPIYNIDQSLGPIDINIGVAGGTVYSVNLIDAFPTTVQAIELNNDLDGLVQITVQISYTRWESITDTQGWIQATAGLGSISNLFG